MKNFKFIFLAIALNLSVQIMPSSEQKTDDYPDAYVTEDAAGNLILVDPTSAAFFSAIDAHNKLMRQQNMIANITPHVRAQDVPLLSQEDTLADIHIAAKLGFSKELRQETEKEGASIDLPTPQLRYTPLHFAARYGHLDAVNLLLSKKANSLAKRQIHWQKANSEALLCTWRQKIIKAKSLLLSLLKIHKR